MATLSADLAAALGDDINPAEFPSLSGMVVENVERLDNTIVQEALSGKQWRSTYEVVPRYKFTIALRFARSSAALLEFQTLLGFYERMGGRLDSFLWQHPDDQSVTAHPFGLGNGSTASFQLQRTLMPDIYLPAAASRSFWPQYGDGYTPIFEPDTSSGPSIYVNGSLKTLTTDYTIQPHGVILFTVAPANGAVLTWTGTYYYRVTFGGGLSLPRAMYQLYKGGSIDLLTVKP